MNVTEPLLQMQQPLRKQREKKSDRKTKISEDGNQHFVSLLSNIRVGKK